jgi:hypothetical protein
LFGGRGAKNEKRRKRGIHRRLDLKERVRRDEIGRFTDEGGLAVENFAVVKPVVEEDEGLSKNETGSQNKEAGPWNRIRKKTSRTSKNSTNRNIPRHRIFGVSIFRVF